MSPLHLSNGKSLVTPSIDSTRSAREGLISSPKHLEVADFPVPCRPVSSALCANSPGSLPGCWIDPGTEVRPTSLPKAGMVEHLEAHGHPSP